MIENCSSILEILAALYITLAFDEVLKHFVQRYHVRNKLEVAMLNNLKDSDLYKQDVEELVKSLCDEYENRFSNFAPIFLYFTLALLYVISLDSCLVQSSFTYIIGTELVVEGLIVFFIFVCVPKLFNQKIVTLIIIFLILTVIMILSFPNLFLFDNVFGIDYDDVRSRYCRSLIMLFILSMPILYMLLYSWAYPASCKSYLENKIKFKQIFSKKLRQQMRNDSFFEYVNALNSQKEIATLETYEKMFRNRGIISLSLSTIWYKIKYSLFNFFLKYIMVNIIDLVNKMNSQSLQQNNN